jgi:hypothetical protein
MRAGGYPRLTYLWEVAMLAAIGFGVIGTIIVIALVVAVVIWLLNRA